MNGFKSVKVPEYMKHIKPYLEINLDAALNTSYSVKKIAVQIAETTDNLIIYGIKEIAEKEGITDLYILDKQNIVAALEKQIPKKPLPEDKWYGNGKCPRCNAVFLDKSTKYCGNCGQALDWGLNNDR